MKITEIIRSLAEHLEERGNIEVKVSLVTPCGNIEFKIDDAGYWEVRAGEYYITGKTIENKSVWYNPLTWNLGYWWIAVILVPIGAYFLFFKKKETEKTGSLIVEG